MYRNPSSDRPSGVRTTVRISVRYFLTLAALLALVAITDYFFHYADRLQAYNDSHVWFRIAMAPIGIAGALSGSVLFLGMLIDCVISRRRSIPARILWFVLILLTNVLGALIYYFRVFNDARATRLLPKVTA